jgi:hypothetical protein
MRFYLGIILGLIIYAMVGTLGLYLLKVCWADYNLSSEDKSYTTHMLIARLLLALLASIAAGVGGAKVANDNGKSSWFVAAVVFCIAAYIHFAVVWRDYPSWYHFTYLLTTLPTIGLSYYFFKFKNKT